MIKANSYTIVDALFGLNGNLMEVLVSYCKIYEAGISYQDFLDMIEESDKTFPSRYLVREFKKLNHVTKQLMFESAKWCVEKDYRAN